MKFLHGTPCEQNAEQFVSPRRICGIHACMSEKDVHAIEHASPWRDPPKKIRPKVTNVWMNVPLAIAYEEKPQKRDFFYKDIYQTNGLSGDVQMCEWIPLTWSEEFIFALCKVAFTPITGVETYVCYAYTPKMWVGEPCEEQKWILWTKSGILGHTFDHR